MRQKDHYQTLGVNASATAAQIKQKYRDLVKQYHPDFTKGDKAKEEKFKEISEAYSILGDEQKRKEYDSFKTNPFANASGFNFNQGWDTRRRPTGDWGPFDHSTFTGENAGKFDDLGDIFSEIFGGSYAGGKRTQRASPQKGSDVYHRLSIDFLDAISGTTLKLALPQRGKTEKINVKIPPGVDQESKIRVTGKGNPGLGGAKTGDLYIVIDVKPHPHFKRKGKDLHLEVPITIKEAVLGAHIDVPTLAGRVSVKVPAGIQGGQQLRLKGKGVKDLKSKEQGDLYVTVKIVVPKQIEARSKKIIEEFDNMNPLTPRNSLFK